MAEDRRVRRRLIDKPLYRQRTFWAVLSAGLAFAGSFLAEEWRPQLQAAGGLLAATAAALAREGGVNAAAETIELIDEEEGATNG